jgi:hypothetical protein
VKCPRQLKKLNRQKETSTGQQHVPGERLRAGEANSSKGGRDTASAGAKVWFRGGKTDGSFVPVNPPEDAVWAVDVKSMPPPKKKQKKD